MTFLGVLKKVITGVPLGILVVTALPVFGAVGAITATGSVVGALVGAACGIADGLNN